MKKFFAKIVLLVSLLSSAGCLTDASMAPVGVREPANLTQEELFGYSSNQTSTKPQEEEEIIRIILLVGIILLLLLILILRFQHTFLEEYNKPD